MDLLMQTSTQSHCHRIAKYFEQQQHLQVFPAEFAESAKELGPLHSHTNGPCLVQFNNVQLSPQQVNAWMQGSFFERPVCRLYWLQHAIPAQPDKQSLLQAVAAAPLPEGVTAIRLDAYPKCLEAQLGDELEEAGFTPPMHPANYSHVLLVVKMPDSGLWRWSYMEKQQLWRHRCDQPARFNKSVATAINKIAEALQVIGLTRNQAACIHGDPSSAKGTPASTHMQQDIWQQLVLQQALPHTGNGVQHDKPLSCSSLQQSNGELQAVRAFDPHQREVHNVPLIKQQQLQDPPEHQALNGAPSTCPSSAAAAVASSTSPSQEAAAAASALTTTSNSPGATHQLQPATRWAIDVGACPGGWTSYLADSCGYSVIAIDPAEMHPEVLARPGVHHVQARSEAALAEIDQLLQGQQVDLVVCDANDHVARLPQFLGPVLPKLKSGGWVIFTLKFHGRGAKSDDVGSRVASMLEGLEPGRCLWLLANTLCERTYVARKL